MSRSRVAPLSLLKSSNTHVQIMSCLQAEDEKEKSQKISFEQAFHSGPAFFEGVLNRHGLSYFTEDLLEKEQAQRLGNLGKIIQQETWLINLINKPEDLHFLTTHPDLANFIHAVTARLIQKPDSLRKWLLALGLSKFVDLMGWSHSDLAEPHFALHLMNQILGNAVLLQQWVELIQKITAQDAIKFKAAEELLLILSHQLSPKAGWLGRAFQVLLEERFSNAVTRKIAELFLKQSPDAQLRILLSIKRPPRSPHEIIEDCIHSLPVPIGTAVYLKLDLPLLVDSEPEVYLRKTLSELENKVSPVSRRPFTEADLRPFLEWANASAAERFIMLVRSQLTSYENRMVSKGAILDFIQSPFLFNYVKNHPLYSLVRRLHKLYPWEDEKVPPSISVLRTDIAQALFLPERGQASSGIELSTQVLNWEKLAKEEAAIKKEAEAADSFCSLSIYCCISR
jgi:hypothetical protein